jgi:RecB family endonuclease NucS
MTPFPSRAAAIVLACPDRTFEEERPLRNYVAANLHLIEPGLRPLRTDRLSIEMSCKMPHCGRIGSIDVVALDSLERLVVIEVKYGVATPLALGQLFAYIAWASRYSEFAGRAIRGMIVANRASALLRLALEYFDSFPVTLVLVPG